MEPYRRRPDDPIARAPPYNDINEAYSDGMTGIEYVMTLSRNGQVSIPAPARARWNARLLLVVDLGDHLAVRPVSADPPRDLRGKYRGRAPDSDTIRRQDRRAEAAARSH